MTFDSIITIAAFCCYLIFMLCIGMYFVGKNRTTNEYFLGGRQLGSWSFLLRYIFKRISEHCSFCFKKFPTL